jgi:ribosomal protein L40E
MKGANGKREDVKMTSEEGEGGLHIVWHVPKVEKGERLEVSFDIKGTGEVDAEALNRFHGVHFGDEIESDDLPEVEEVEEAVEDESTEAESTEEGAESTEEEAEATEEEAEAEATEEEAEAEATVEEAEAEATEEEAEAESKMNWREDVLLRVMEASGITDRDAFIAFAADYDSDDNGYLKKGELEDAANAWNAREAEGSDDVAEKVCEICDTINPADATECSACKFTFN